MNIIKIIPLKTKIMKKILVLERLCLINPKIMINLRNNKLFHNKITIYCRKS